MWPRQVVGSKEKTRITVPQHEEISGIKQTHRCGRILRVGEREHPLPSATQTGTFLSALMEDITKAAANRANMHKHL